MTMLIDELKKHYPFKEPMALYEAIKNYRDWYRISLVGKRDDVDAVRAVAISFRKLHPTWPKVDFTDLLGGMQWCVDAEQVRQAILDKPKAKKGSGADKTKPKRRANKQLEEHIKEAQEKLFGDTDPKHIARRIALDHSEYHAAKPQTITKTMQRMRAKAKKN